MNIDEFIEHTQEEARTHRYHAAFFDIDNPMRTDCIRNAEDCEWLADCLTKFKEYQQLEEQKGLIKFPCKIGDDVYFVPSKVNYDLNVLNDKSQFNTVYHQNVERITFTKNGWFLECDKNRQYGIDYVFTSNYYKETWFLKREEAEAKLAELRGSNND